MLILCVLVLSLPSSQGAGDLQPNRAYNVIRSVIWALGGLVLLVALVLGVTAVTLPGCKACHNAPVFVQQTAAGAHSKIECVRCHVQPGVPSRVDYAFHLIFGMGLRVSPTSSGPIAGIPNATCLSCHAAVMKRVVIANGISIKHELCIRGRLCTDCHSQTAHGGAVKWAKTPQMNQCLDCHAASKVRSDCTMCHSARSPQDRIRTGSWAVTHGPNWKQTHGMGVLKTCASCHPDNYCVRCHGIPLPHGPDFMRTHPVQAMSNRKDCAVCHKQAFCDNCHGLEMPHPVTFAPLHSSIVKKQGSAKCLRCHIQEDCDLCHLKHIHPGGATLPPGIGLR